MGITGEIRTSPPSDKPNNQDVFIWSLYLLGGSDRDIDVEDVYIKAFELAPARLGWRTRPEICDYKRTSKALQSVEAKTHKGLVHRPHMHSRRLTAQGVAWIEAHKSILERNYSGAPVRPDKAHNKHEKLRVDLQESPVWRKFETHRDDLELADLARVLRCAASSPSAVWKSRIEELRRAAQVLQDPSLNEFALFVETKVTEGL
jgi:hypothetical protein